MTDIPTRLQHEVAEFVRFLADPNHDAPPEYECLVTRLDFLNLLTQSVAQEDGVGQDKLQQLQEWFRQQTEVLSAGNLIRRARTWPAGYPGDYLTVEAVYANEPKGSGLAQHIDRYFLTRTLAVAVRSRLRKLANILNQRSAAEGSNARWLNLACGSCRELVFVSDRRSDRVIFCVDTDKDALEYAKALVGPTQVGDLQCITENVLRLISSDRNIERFGRLTTIYSAGLFDYIRSDVLAKLIRALYDSLGNDGVFIIPFKDRARYLIFDYHWVVKWHHFLQRSEHEYRQVFADAGIPEQAITMERDASGVILFFVVKK